MGDLRQVVSRGFQIQDIAQVEGGRRADRLAAAEFQDFREETLSLGPDRDFDHSVTRVTVNGLNTSLRTCANAEADSPRAQSAQDRWVMRAALAKSARARSRSSRLARASRAPSRRCLRHTLQRRRSGPDVLCLGTLAHALNSSATTARP